MNLLGFGERFAIGTVADDMVAWETLGFVQLSRLQHPYADIDDHIWSAFDGHCDQCQGGGAGGRRRYCVSPYHWCRNSSPVDHDTLCFF